MFDCKDYGDVTDGKEDEEVGSQGKEEEEDGETDDVDEEELKDDPDYYYNKLLDDVYPLRKVKPRPPDKLYNETYTAPLGQVHPSRGSRQLPPCREEEKRFADSQDDEDIGEEDDVDDDKECDYQTNREKTPQPVRLPYSYYAHSNHLNGQFEAQRRERSSLLSIPTATSTHTNTSRQSVSVSPPTSRRTTIHTPQTQEYTSVLITDSIMRKIKEDELGANHKLHIINKRDTTGLIHNSLRSTLKQLKPHFIYIHLGINDLTTNRPINQIMANYGEFLLFVDQEIGLQTKVIFSFPLLNGYKPMYPRIMELRDQLHNWITKLDKSVPMCNKHLLFNPNTNFFKKDNNRSILWNQQATELFNTREGDYVHLSFTGIRTILGNFRHIVHRIIRESAELDGTPF